MASEDKTLIYDRTKESPNDDDFDDDDFLKRVPRTENTPELVALIEDEEVLEHLSKPRTTELLREISIDPSKIEQLIDEPELKFLKRKMLEQLKKTHPEINVDM